MICSACEKVNDCPMTYCELPHCSCKDTCASDGNKFVAADWYDLKLADGRVVSCDDILVALGHNHRVSHAFKYLFRAGRKPGQPARQDLEKALNFLTKELTDSWSRFGKGPK